MKQRYQVKHDRDPEVARHRSSKNTRRWCRGKVGREHKAAWVPADTIPHFNSAYSTRSYRSKHQVFLCSVCKKELNSSWPIGDIVGTAKTRCKCGAQAPGVVASGWSRRYNRRIYFTCACGRAWSVKT